MLNDGTQDENIGFQNTMRSPH